MRGPDVSCFYRFDQSNNVNISEVVWDLVLLYPDLGVELAELPGDALLGGAEGDHLGRPHPVLWPVHLHAHDRLVVEQLRGLALPQSWKHDWVRVG